MIDAMATSALHIRLDRYSARSRRKRQGALIKYPPYHSKYNPIERCWSSLEKKWNGVLLNCWETIGTCALRMTWRGMHPMVERLRDRYVKGIGVPKEEMKQYEARLERSATLPAYDLSLIHI